MVRAGVDLTHFIAFSENALADKETPRTKYSAPEMSQAASTQNVAKPSCSSSAEEAPKRQCENKERETVKCSKQAGCPPPHSPKKSSERGKPLEIPESQPNICAGGADV
jgi:hypothetical protein